MSVAWGAGLVSGWLPVLAHRAKHQLSIGYLAGGLLDEPHRLVNRWKGAHRVGDALRLGR